VVALNAEGAIVLIGSCKWTNSPMDMTEYAALLADVKAVASGLKLDANEVGTAQGPWLALFSRAGFTPRLEQLAVPEEPQRLLLFALPTLYKEN